MGKNIKRFLLVLLCTGISYAQALSVGDIAVETALNQPLKATIVLRNLGSNTVEDITVNLARPSDFEVADIEYLGFLRDLRFDVVNVGGSASKIEVRSTKAIREPYVNFLLSIAWPDGQLLKEYTILLDPVFGDTSISSSQANVAEQVQATAAPAIQRRPSQQNQKPVQQFQQRFNRANDNASTITVAPQDTLWNIAKRVGPSNRSVHQVMHALKSANPDAFINNNINTLKAGSQLTIPSESEFLGISAAEAVSATRRDLALWKGAPSSAADTSLAIANKPAGELQLAAADDSSSAAVIAEQFDALSSENEDLSSRVGSLEEQLEDLNRLLELKNKQLALLQQQSIDSASGEALAAVDLNTADSLPEEPLGLLEEPSGLESEVNYELIASAESGSEDSAAKLASSQKLTGGMPQDFQPSLALWQQVPVQLGGLGGVCVLLMMALWLRRSPNEETFFVEDGDVVLDSTDEEEYIPLPELDAEAEAEVEVEADSDELDELENLSDQFKDNGYEAAIIGLEAKVNDQAHRADLRLLLLQKSSEAGDKERFVENYRFLEAIAKPEDIQRAGRILLASQGSMDWLEPDTVDDDDDFFKEIVHEAELTDEIEALLLASEGETSLDDQQDLEDFDFESVDSTPSSDEAASLDMPLGLDADNDTVGEDSNEETALDFEQTLILAPEANINDLSLAEDDSLDFDFDASIEPSNVDEDLTMPADDDHSDLADDGLDFESTIAVDGLDFDATSTDSDFDDELGDFDLDGFGDLSAEGEPTIDDGTIQADTSEIVDLDDDLELDDELDLSESLDLQSVDLNDDALDEDLGEDELADFDFSAGVDETSLDDIVLSDGPVENDQRDEDDAALEDFSGFLDGVDEAALADEDEIATKLELGEAFIEMGDLEDADEILKEVLQEGDVVQQATARELLDKLNS